jgi:hypothetical protein
MKVRGSNESKGILAQRSHRRDYALLQPVAHALLQSEREVKSALQDFPDSMLWEKPADMAAVGFQLQHLTGVLDRLFTYAKENLSQMRNWPICPLRQTQWFILENWLTSFQIK